MMLWSSDRLLDAELPSSLAGGTWTHEGAGIWHSLTLIGRAGL